MHTHIETLGLVDEYEDNKVATLDIEKDKISIGDIWSTAEANGDFTDYVTMPDYDKIVVNGVVYVKQNESCK